MFVYRLSGWESYTYCTHTAFVASSKEEAHKLCSELYDTEFPKYSKFQELVELKGKYLDNLRDAVEHKISRLELEEERIRRILNFNAFLRAKINTGLHTKYMLNLKTQIQDLRKSLRTTPYDDALNKAQEGDLFWNALDFQVHSSKEEHLEMWMLRLEEIPLDKLFFAVQQDGD